jgi:hypothetical protein
MMNKRALVLLTVLGLASSAYAQIVTFDASAEPDCIHGQPVPSVDVMPGSVVVVEITADTAVAAGYLVSITESTTSAAGYAGAGLGTLHPGFTGPNSPGNLQNQMTNSGGTPIYILIDRIYGTISDGDPPIAAGQVLYQFELLIPQGAVFCDTFTVTAAVGFPIISPPPGGYVHQIDAANVASTNALTIHVIPEPMTIALLGLGGLMLRRRKK